MISIGIILNDYANWEKKRKSTFEYSTPFKMLQVRNLSTTTIRVPFSWDWPNYTYIW